MSRTPEIQSPVGDRTLVMANYTKLSENIRRLTPHGIQCSVFCGGTNCKYENPESWTADSLALQGIYSHWITDDILAMARPSTAVIIKKNIIQQFQSLGIKSIINLQCPKEHASCGEPLEDSGFSYDPNLFMENNNLPSSPDSIKIPSCNSSYACSSLSISPSASEYEDPADTSPQLSDSYSDLSTLDGDEIREEIDEQLLAENKCFQELETQKNYDESLIPKELYSTADVTNALLTDFETVDADSKQYILHYKYDINTSQFGWTRLRAESNLAVLAALLFEWLEGLKAPILGKDSLEAVVIYFKQPEKCFNKFPLEEACLMEYLLNFLTKLQPMMKEDQDDILLRFVASFAQQTILIKDKALPTGKSFQKLREGTLNCTTQFFKSLLLIIGAHHKHPEKVQSSLNCDTNTKDLENFSTGCGFH